MKKQCPYKCPRCGGKMHKNGVSSSGKQKWACAKFGTGIKNARTLCYETVAPWSAKPRTHDKFGAESAPPPEFKRDLAPACATFLYTAVQDSTLVHSGFWRALQHARKYYDAELIALAYYYRNPTSVRETTNRDRDVWWDKRAQPYLWNVRHKVNSNLEVLGDIPIQPTAESPLAGLEGFSGAESTIVGAPKLEFKTVATPGSRMAKIMTTTGACTRSTNYSRSKAGKKGEFHHTLGAVIVEAEGPLFWLRHLSADKSGSFTDQARGVRFTPNGVRKAPRPLAAVLGDAHVRIHDKAVDEARFGAGGVVESLKPRNLVWHDTLDGSTHNHHEIKDPFITIANHRAGKASVQDEVHETIRFVRGRTPPFARSWVIPSNHDDFLRRWIVEQNWKTDPLNAEFYLETALAMVKGSKRLYAGAEYPSPFPYWFSRVRHARIKCLGRGQSLKFAGIECGMHGDIGPNGARGSVRNLRRIGTKGVSGHNHTPTISEGWYSVGTGSVLDPPYTRGSPSAWMQADCLIDPRGKRQLIIFVNGRWRR